MNFVRAGWPVRPSCPSSAWARKMEALLPEQHDPLTKRVSIREAELRKARAQAELGLEGRFPSAASKILWNRRDFTHHAIPYLDLPRLLPHCLSSLSARPQK